MNNILYNSDVVMKKIQSKRIRKSIVAQAKLEEVRFFPIQKDSTPLVTIICLCYNHENYISRCIESILNQKVNFSVEILIHDDASIDGSQSIIESYKNKYPNIIRTFFEKTNQYSKGVNIEDKILSKFIRGNYVAFCECDDYFLDTYKLVSQVFCFRKYDDICFAVHRTKCENSDGKLLRLIPGNVNKSYIFGRKKIVPNIITNYTFHTTSYFLKADDYKKYCTNSPLFVAKTKVGDYPLQLYFANLGKTLYLNDVMSVHVDNVPGSWTNKNRNASVTVKNEALSNIIDCISLFDEYTCHTYHKTCLKKIATLEMHQLFNSNKFFEIISKKKYARALKKYDFRTFLGLFLRFKHPTIYRLVKRLRV